ncbi:MAG: hypothetical protein HRT51_12050 [Colwellia sp.]|nr:hypothetical protein [Colwellia sp.]
MNKVLIGIVVVISAYLAYGSLTNEEDNTAITAEKSLAIQEEIEETPVPEDVYENTGTTIDGRYVLNITTDTTETSQEFTFSSDGTFELSRQMISPNPALAGSIEGTYFIQGNTINLVFPADRDKKTFSLDTAEMTIKSETELEYGGYIARLD